MTTIQKAFIAATLAVAIGTAIHEARRASQLEEQADFTHVVLDRQWQRIREEAALAARRQKGQLLRDQSEILALRAEVAKLQANAGELARVKANAASNDNDPTKLALNLWVDRVKKLNEKLGQMPDQRIPEMQLLSAQDWFNAVGNMATLETDADFRQAFTALRNSAKDEFANLAQSALRGYAQANNGQPPSDISQLQPYFGSSVDGSVLQRYQVTQPGTVTEVATPLDDQDDKYYQISMNTINSSSRDEDILQPAAAAFAAANNGQTPTDPSKLLPYVTTPAEQAAIQKLIQNPAGR